VRAIKALGVSVLIAESHVQNAGRIADRLYAIDRGEIIFAGRPGELIGNAEVMKTLHG
jgi:branched-chain amino acid transport system ATP-binding protein